MRIEPGAHRHTSTSGVELYLDTQVTQPVVDRIASAIDHAGRTPDEITAAEIDRHGVVLHCLPADAAEQARRYGRIDHEVIRV